MVMRLERYISCTAAGTLASLLQSDRLSVDDAVKRVTSLSDDLAVGGHNDTADERIRADQPEALCCEVESTLYECLVVNLCGCYLDNFLTLRALPRYFSSSLLSVIDDVRLQLEAFSAFWPTEFE